MDYQNVFKRYELKYMLTSEQKEAMLKVMEPHMAMDKYGRTTIRNIYFDTDNFRLIRRSMEKPCYKEKLRLRSYGAAGGEDPAFLELKKKYRSVVYKRRIEIPCETAMECLRRGEDLPVHSQIAREIDYFSGYYHPLRPSVFLSYEREAYFSKDGGDFRVTFDENILFRQRAISLDGGVYGTPVLEPGKVLMEIKTSGAVPLWMTGFLSREGIFKTSFSKYAAAYQTIVSRGSGDA